MPGQMKRTSECMYFEALIEIGCVLYVPGEDTAVYLDEKLIIDRFKLINIDANLVESFIPTFVGYSGSMGIFVYSIEPLSGTIRAIEPITTEELEELGHKELAITLNMSLTKALQSGFHELIAQWRQLTPPSHVNMKRAGEVLCELKNEVEMAEYYFVIGCNCNDMGDKSLAYRSRMRFKIEVPVLNGEMNLKENQRTLKYTASYTSCAGYCHDGEKTMLKMDENMTGSIDITDNNSFVNEIITRISNTIVEWEKEMFNRMDAMNIRNLVIYLPDRRLNHIAKQGQDNHMSTVHEVNDDLQEALARRRRKLGGSLVDE